jgi:NADPH:quinone reductase-like Zn-dependent oxidoreductase
MKAIQLAGTRLVEVEKPEPVAGAGELLIYVRAAGVIPSEITWQPTTHTKDGGSRTNAVPGHEFSGVVAKVGEGVTGFSVGQEVYGMNDWYADGAMAEFCVTQPNFVAPKPASLSDDEAASVPISALTAWQGLVIRAKVQAGEKVLVLGGSGAVGIFAVQIAKLQGAHVIATASAAKAEIVGKLGADEVIDYKVAHFDDTVRDVDVVFDTVGGATLALAWDVLKPGGRLVTVSSSEESAERSHKGAAFFIVEPNQEQLIEVARLIDAGTLKVFVKAVVPLSDAAQAYDEKSRYQRGLGKTVVAI